MNKSCILALIFIFNAPLVEGQEVDGMENAVELAGAGSDHEKEKAIDFLERTVSSGDTKILQALSGIRARIALGMMDAEQRSIRVNPENVERYLRIGEILARHGNASAKYDLANDYSEGRYGIVRNVEKAFQWYSLSADAGNSKSAIALSKMYRDGEGVKKDEYKAYELVSSVAKNGDEEAMFLLAAYLEDGVGTSVDIEASIRILKQVKSPLAKIKIGLFYSKGKGVLQDYSEAITWFTKAAATPEDPYPNRMFVSDAKYLLGVMYRGGLGVKRDLVKAHMWFNLAAAQGNSEAESARDDLVLSATEIAKAQLLAKNWKPSR